MSDCSYPKTSRLAKSVHSTDRQHGLFLDQWNDPIIPRSVECLLFLDRAGWGLGLSSCICSLPNLGALPLPRLGVLPLLRLVAGLLVRRTIPLPRLGVLLLLRLVAGLLVRRTLPLPRLGVLKVDECDLFLVADAPHGGRKRLVELTFLWWSVHIWTTVERGFTFTPSLPMKAATSRSVALPQLCRQRQAA